MQLSTVIFDMDGLLIDSEPLWGEAAAFVFRNYNIELSPAQYATTTGLRTREFVSHWFRHFHVPDENRVSAQSAIEEKVSELIASKGRPMPGLGHILEYFRGKGFRIGLASSSGLALIRQVIEQLKIEPYLAAYASAEHLEYGKPHPEVYLRCAEMLQALPAECLCFEDSFNGMIAVKAARMKCVVVPSAKELHRPEWSSADLKISSLQNFNDLLLYSL